MSVKWNVALSAQDRVYRLTGRDALDLLQRISTNDLSPVAKGGGATTILTNEKGRIVSVIGVHGDPDGSLWVVSPMDQDGSTARWLERFIIMEDVVIQDVTKEFRSITSFMLDPGQARWQNSPDVKGFPTIPVHSWDNRWSTVIVPRRDDDALPSALIDAGATPISLQEFHDIRVIAGVPWGGTELTDQRHPLEARLRSLISFTKGCYIGQEVVARLDSYRKVQMVLSRFVGSVPQDIILPTQLFTTDGQESGIITTVRSVSDDYVCALGFIRTPFAAADGTFSIPSGGSLRALDIQVDSGVYKDQT